ncbi:RidA family protein [Candidatus Bathyarchaeota archaeon]|nr:RidA family protein [Candidatus Bathyarchaeota archaeon]
MSYEERAKSMGITIPKAATPVGAYLLAVQSGTLIFTAGQGPVKDGVPAYKGKIGRDLTVEDGYEAAKLAALNCLAAAKSVLGTLDRVERVVKVNGYVNSAPGFTDQPKVMNGASDVLAQIFGENGRHARTSVGVNELPMNIAVEVELVLACKP